MQPRAILFTLAAGVLFGGCARRENFLPAEKASGPSPEGFTAAEYDLSSKGDDIGEVRVWSSGAEEIRNRGDEVTVLHVGFEVDNSSDEPLRIPVEGVRLESVGLDDEVLEGIAVSTFDGPEVVRPHESALIHASFLMPAGVKPDDLDNFRVRWEVQSNGTVQAEWTPFVERPFAYDTYAYAPIYDPYYAGAFGPPAYGTLYGYPYAYRYAYPYAYPY